MFFYYGYPSTGGAGGEGAHSIAVLQVFCYVERRIETANIHTKRDGDLTRLAFSSWPRAFRAENAVRDFAASYFALVCLLYYGVSLITVKSADGVRQALFVQEESLRGQCPIISTSHAPRCGVKV